MDHQCLRGQKLLLLNVALGLGTFIQILDTSIANVAVPYIAGSLAVSPDQGTWVITSFAASNAVVLPLTGWLADYFGRVKLFVASVLLFAFMSFLCGTAHSLTALVIYRVLQGAVAGSLIPLSQSLLMAHNPDEKKGAALGFWAMVVIVAPVVGPILGGYLSDEYSWPWIFYINVPIGLFSAGVTWVLLKDKESEIIRNPIDWIGLFFLTVSVGCLQVMLDKGKDLDWFESNAIIALCVISVISLTYFVFWNMYQKFPIVDFSFFKDRNYSLGTLITTFGYLIFFGSTVIIPLWLQTEMRYNAFWAGVAVAPIGIIPVLLSTYIGKNMSKVDIRKLCALSFFLFAIGFFLQSNLTTEVSLEYLMAIRLFQGAAVSIFFIPLVQLTLGNIPTNKYAHASGIFNFVRILVGSGFGTSLSIYFWSRLEIFHHSRLTELATIYNNVTQEFYKTMEAISSSFTPQVVNVLLDMGIEQQAFMLSTNDMSWLSGWIFVFMIPIPFLCKRIVTSKAGGASGAH